MTERQDEEGPVEIAIVGDLTDSEADLTDRLLGVEPGGECTIYFDSPGGSPYCAVSLMTLIKMRNLKATGIVRGRARPPRFGHLPPAIGESLRHSASCCFIRCAGKAKRTLAWLKLQNGHAISRRS